MELTFTKRQENYTAVQKSQIDYGRINKMPQKINTNRHRNKLFENNCHIPDYGQDILRKQW